MRFIDSPVAKTWKSSITTLPFSDERLRCAPRLSVSAKSSTPLVFSFAGSSVASAWLRSMRTSFMPSMAMLWRLAPRSALG